MRLPESQLTSNNKETTDEPDDSFHVCTAAGSGHRAGLGSDVRQADMVADAPTDPKKFKNPSTLVFTYTPVEDPAVYEKIFKPFTDYLAQCTAKRVVFYQVQSNAAEIEAMRSGRLHVGGFSTGPTAFAVNIAGAVPFAIKGYEKDFQGYNLIVIVKKDSPFQKLSDLKGHKVAHTAPSSNSGHMAPMALFPKEGLAPEKDYKILFSGKHDQSVMGVNSGDYEAAVEKLRGSASKLSEPQTPPTGKPGAKPTKAADDFF